MIKDALRGGSYFGVSARPTTSTWPLPTPAAARYCSRPTARRRAPRELWKWAVSKTRLRAYELRKLFGGRGERGSDFFLESTSHCAGISKLTFL